MPYPPREAPRGQILHVRTRATGDEKLHRDAFDYDGMLWNLGLQVLGHELHCLAYCLMPNHVHLVLRPDGDVSAAMRDLLNRYVQRYNRRWGRRGHLVETRFRCTPARSTAHAYELFRYLPLNPVEANLERRPEQWPHSSYAATLGLVEPPIWLDVASALRLFHERPSVARAEYRAFVEGRLL